MTTVTEPRAPLVSPDRWDDELEALIEEARRRARRRRLLLAAAVLCAAAAGAGLFAAIAYTGVTGPDGHGAPPARGLLANGRPTAYHPYSFGYVKEGFLGDRRPRDRILIAHTRKQGLQWQRSLTARRTTPPGGAYFPEETLVGVFLLGHSAAQGVAVTDVAVNGRTLALALKVSPLPVARCGQDPSFGYECRPMYKAPSSRYHAMTIISVPRKAARGVNRVVVTDEVDVPSQIEVDYPG